VKTTLTLASTVLNEAMKRHHHEDGLRQMTRDELLQESIALSLVAIAETLHRTSKAGAAASSESEPR
jgi:hypothetical protein